MLQRHVRLLGLAPTVVLLSILIWLLASGGQVTEARSVLHVPKDYATIQEAVDFAGSGDIIQVAKGTYAESVVIDGKTGIWLFGRNSVLQGSQAGIGIHLLNSDRIRIQGFIVEHYWTGILLEGTQNSRIHNVVTRFNVDPASSRSDAISFQNGLDLVGSHHNLITNVFSHHNGHNGITLKGGSMHNTLRGNTANDNGKHPLVLATPAGCGIQLSRDGNHNNIITANETLRNAFGILLSGRNSSNPNPAGADNNTITQNRSHDNARSGIDIRDKSSGNFVGQNNATGNGGGGSPNIDLNDQAGVGEDPTDPAVLDNTWKNNKGNSNF